jgi:hypothetical protein
MWPYDLATNEPADTFFRICWLRLCDLDQMFAYGLRFPNLSLLYQKKDSLSSPAHIKTGLSLKCYRFPPSGCSRVWYIHLSPLKGKPSVQLFARTVKSEVGCDQLRLESLSAAGCCPPLSIVHICGRCFASLDSNGRIWGPHTSVPDWIPAPALVQTGVRGNDGGPAPLHSLHQLQ